MLSRRLKPVQALSPLRLAIVHRAIYSRLLERKRDLLFEGSGDPGSLSGPDSPAGGADKPLSKAQLVLVVWAGEVAWLRKD